MSWGNGRLLRPRYVGALPLGICRLGILAKAEDYTRDQWEAALDKAEQRAEPLQ
jgi:hypothetical protein